MGPVDGQSIPIEYTAPALGLGIDWPCAVQLMLVDED